MECTNASFLALFLLFRPDLERMTNAEQCPCSCQKSKLKLNEIVNSAVYSSPFVELCGWAKQAAPRRETPGSRPPARAERPNRSTCNFLLKTGLEFRSCRTILGFPVPSRPWSGHARRNSLSQQNQTADFRTAKQNKKKIKKNNNWLS